MKVCLLALNLVVFVTSINNCDSIRKDSSLAFTSRVLLIDLDDTNVAGLELDTLFKKYSDQFNNKLCFLSPSTGEVQVVTSKDRIDKDVHFNDILAIRVIGKNKYVNMLDDVKRKIVIQFRQPNRNTLMANGTLHQFLTGGVEKKSALGSHEVDIKHPEKLLLSDIEFVLKLGVRDTK